MGAGPFKAGGSSEKGRFYSAIGIAKMDKALNQGYIKIISMISSNQTNTVTANYRGTNKLLTGIVLAVITFWLFAQTTLNIAPVMNRSQHQS